MQRVVRGSHRIVNFLSEVCVTLATVAVVVVILAVTSDVTLRTMTGSGVRGVVEYGEVLMVVIVFMGLAHAQMTRSHVSVEILTERLSPRNYAVFQGLVLAAAAVFLFWMTSETLVKAMDSFADSEVRFGLVSVPMWPARFALPFGLLMMGLQSALQSIDSFRSLQRQDNRATPVAAVPVID